MDNAPGPTTFKAPDPQVSASQISKKPRQWYRGSLFRIVITVLIIGVLAEVIYGGFSLFAPSTARNLNPLQPTVNEMTSARLSLIPDKASYKKGETVIIDVKLYTGGYTTASTDLALKYDPLFLKPQGENFAVPGQIYPEYPAVQVEGQKGLIGISGIPMDSSQSFSGVGLFAKLNFIALKEGQTEITIDYQPDLTGDSNVVLSSSSKDVLGVVDNAQITISANGSPGAQETRGQSCDGFTQNCQISSGAVGTQICNTGTIKEGSCGYDPKLTTSCEECKI